MKIVTAAGIYKMIIFDSLVQADCADGILLFGLGDIFELVVFVTVGQGDG